VPLVESDALAPSEAPLRERQYFNNYQDSTSDITKVLKLVINFIYLIPIFFPVLQNNPNPRLMLSYQPAYLLIAPVVFHPKHGNEMPKASIEVLVNK